MSQYRATVAITTHNRKDELPAAVDSCLAQSLGERLQVVVVDDGSKDGTTDMLRERYGHLPNVVLDAQQPGIGLIAERNRFPELCDGPIIFSMDDDAVFQSAHTVEQTLAEFEHPEYGDWIGAIAIPYIDVKIEPDAVRQAPPESKGVFAAEQYRGTAHAIRKDLFVELGRYRGQLWRQGEENDYCIRLYDAGYAVVLGRADPIHHMESPKRSKPAIYAFTARNNMWFAWHNVPAPQVFAHLGGTAALNLLDGFKQPARFFPRASGVLQGLGGIIGKERGERAPVSAEAYGLSRRLRAGGPVLLESIVSELKSFRDKRSTRG
ncbi:MAG: glycosyltransferase family A protein [Planctomycetota bacterium]